MSCKFECAAKFYAKELGDDLGIDPRIVACTPLERTTCNTGACCPKLDFETLSNKVDETAVDFDALVNTWDGTEENIDVFKPSVVHAPQVAKFNQRLKAHFGEPLDD
jgi:hypothetical protein